MRYYPNFIELILLWMIEQILEDTSTMFLNGCKSAIDEELEIREFIEEVQ